MVTQGRVLENRNLTAAFGPHRMTNIRLLEVLRWMTDQAAKEQEINMTSRVSHIDKVVGLIRKVWLSSPEADFYVFIKPYLNRNDDNVIEKLEKTLDRSRRR